MHRCFGLVVLAVILTLSFTPARAWAQSRPLISEDRLAAGYWKTDKAKVLDNDLIKEKLRSILGKAGGSAGASEGETGKKPTPQESANQILQLILAEQRGAQGVHIETALATLGALAGFSCPIAIREGFVASGKLKLDTAFTKISTKSGETFYTGRYINECLASGKKGQFSVWALVGGAAEHLKKPVPDLTEIVKRVTGQFGSPNYGSFELPNKHMPQMAAEPLLWKYWNVTRNTLALNEQEPAFWPFILGMAAQQLILMGKDTIDPTIGAEIVMQAAYSMSRIDPTRIHSAYLS